MFLLTHGIFHESSMIALLVALLLLLLFFWLAWLYWRRWWSSKKDGYEAKISEHVANYNHLVSHRDQLTSSNKDLELRIKQLGKDNDGLNSQLGQARSDIDGHLSRISDLEPYKVKYEDANQAFKDSESRFGALNLNLKGAQDKIGLLNGNLGDRDKTIADLRAQLEKANASLRTATSENDDLKAKLKACQDARANLEAKIGELNNTIDNLNGRVDALNNELEGKSATIIQLQAALGERDAKLSILDEEITGHKSNILQLQGGIGERDAKLSLFDVEVDGRDKRIAELEAQLGAIDSLRQQLNAANENNGILNTKLQGFAGMEADLNSLRSNNDALKAELEALRNKISNLDEHNTKLSLDLDACKKRGGDLESALENCDGAYSKLKGELDDVNAAFEALKASAALDKGMLQEHINALEIEMEEANEAANAVDTSNMSKNELTLHKIAQKKKSLDFGIIGTASESEKDDLKRIKGVGPFLEQKMNALGIYTFRQVANFTPDLEDKVNDAIEFFPGRIKRDEWVRQARNLMNGGEGDAMATPPEKKKGKRSKEEQLAAVRAKAGNVNFDRIGRADAGSKDDLKEISGIGPFIEEKLNALGIYTFKQVSNFTPEDEEIVNDAIEFFPGRIKRDEWARQARELHAKK